MDTSNTYLPPILYFLFFQDNHLPLLAIFNVAVLIDVVSLQ